MATKKKKRTASDSTPTRLGVAQASVQERGAGAPEDSGNHGARSPGRDGVDLLGVGPVVTRLGLEGMKRLAQGKPLHPSTRKSRYRLRYRVKCLWCEFEERVVYDEGLRALCPNGHRRAILGHVE